MPYIRKASQPVFDKGSDTDVLCTWVGEELEQIEKSALDDIIALELRPTGQTPSRPREGMIVYADGSNYNPGFGEGPYVYRNGVWVPLAGRGTWTSGFFVVSTTGSDTTGDGSFASPFATIQYAVDKAAFEQDFGASGFSVIVLAGTYNITTTGSQPACALRNYVGKGPFGIIGDIANPSNVVLNVTGGDVFGAASVLGQYNIAGFTCKANTSGFGILRASGGSTFINFQAIRYNGASFNVFADYGAQIFLLAPQTIIADSAFHYGFTNKGIIQDAGKVVTLSGARTINIFAFGNNNGLLNIGGTTYTRSPETVGQKFNNDSLGIINTAGAGINVLPGTIAGISWSGGYF